MKREFGIDSLKMVAMLLIVADHIILWGGYGLGAGKTGLKGVSLAIINAFTLFSVNCFGPSTDFGGVFQQEDNASFFVTLI